MIRGMAPTRSKKTADVKRRPTLAGSERKPKRLQAGFGPPILKPIWWGQRERLYPGPGNFNTPI
jgi:hypothetical protein